MVGLSLISKSVTIGFKLTVFRGDCPKSHWGECRRCSVGSVNYQRSSNLLPTMELDSKLSCYSI